MILQHTVYDLFCILFGTTSSFTLGLLKGGGAQLGHPHCSVKCLTVRKQKREGGTEDGEEGETANRQ